MAILRSCCCWNGVRKGSFASGVYTLVLYTIIAACTGVNMHNLHHSEKTSESNIEIGEHESGESLWLWYIVMLLSSSLVVAMSVILLMGLQKNRRYLLIPWMVALTLSSLLYLISYILSAVFLAEINTTSIIVLIIDIVVTCLNVYCLLCVISQYQELKCGRGRAFDERWQQAMVLYQPGPGSSSITSNHQTSSIYSHHSAFSATTSSSIHSQRGDSKGQPLKPALKTSYEEPLEPLTTDP